MLEMPLELQQAVRSSPNPFVYLEDPGTKIEYVILPAKKYAQVQSLFIEHDPLTNGEQQHLLIKAGLRAGWDDPEMDIYNDLDPRRQL